MHSKAVLSIEGPPRWAVATRLWGALIAGGLIMSLSAGAQDQPDDGANDKRPAVDLPIPIPDWFPFDLSTIFKIPEGERSVTMARGLDKVTARTTDLELIQDQPVRYGTLRIIARSCVASPPEETPETLAYLEIDEVRRGGGAVPLFRGWMVASSPGLNALEHPVYDVWVTSCKALSPDAGSSSAVN